VRTIEEDEALLRNLETNRTIARKSADYLIARLREVVDRRRKGIKGDEEADKILRTNCIEAVKKMGEFEALYDRAVENAGLPPDRRKT
jgi:hypothetical protein